MEQTPTSILEEAYTLTKDNEDSASILPIHTHQLSPMTQKEVRLFETLEATV